MKVTIEFEVGEDSHEDIFLILSRAHQKILNQLQRVPGCICTAPEADDQLRDYNGNVVGSVKVVSGEDPNDQPESLHRDPLLVHDEQELWDNNLVQFARLICEIMATQDNFDINGLCEAMDLSKTDLAVLMDRANTVWEEAKYKYTW